MMLGRYRILCFLIFALCSLIPPTSGDMRLQPMKMGEASFGIQHCPVLKTFTEAPFTAQTVPAFCPRSFKTTDDCIGDDFKKHPVNSRWYSKNKCEEHTCLFIKGILYVMQSGCGKMGYPSECKLVPGNKDKHYPDCCPQVECPPIEYDYYDMR